MFVEVKRSMYERLKKVLQELGVSYEPSDCTLPGDKEQMVHIEIVSTLTERQRLVIDKELEEMFGRADIGIDKDGNEIPDYLEEEEGKVVERRTRKWDQKMHTLSADAAAWFTGKNEEEEVTYESK
jgi:hypothetical protein